MESPVLNVSQFVQLLDQHLLSLGHVVVEGEISDFKIKDGKWVLFSLKDADSRVRCFMTAWSLRTALEDGMLVRAVGEVRVKQWGELSFTVKQITPAGEGALRRAFQLLREKLAMEGLFAPERKRPLPRFPQHIALITSRDAAAYTDFLKVLQARQGGLNVSFLHSQVQGAAAAEQLCAALAYANTHLTCDVIVMVRGGGSLEDLQSFNDEEVIRAVAGSRIPIVVGVGHERDVTLAELAADVRASTPSNAAELVVTSRSEIVGNIDHMTQRLHGHLLEAIRLKQRAILHQVQVLISRMHESREAVAQRIHRLISQGQRLRYEITARREHVERRRQQLHHHLDQRVQQRAVTLTHMMRLLQSLSPEQTLARGYSITRTEDGQLVKEARHVVLGERLTTRLAQGELVSRVEDR